MNMKCFGTLAVALPLLLATSCTQLGPGKHVSMQGPDDLFDYSSLEEIDLIALLHPVGEPPLPGEEEAVKKTTAANGNMGFIGQKVKAKVKDDEPLGTAFAHFAQTHKAPEDYSAARNAVQDRIIAASEQRFGRFKRHLTAVGSGTEFGFSSLTTMLTAAATVFTPASTVKALAAGATVSNEVRTSFNSSYYRSKTSEVLIMAIEVDRKRVLNEILTRRQEGRAYTVEAAVSDAIRYNHTASINTAFASLQKSLVKDAEKQTKELKKTSEKVTKPVPSPEEELEAAKTALEKAQKEVDEAKGKVKKAEEEKKAKTPEEG